MATFMLKESTSSQKMATSMLEVASDIYKMPLYRNAHSPELPSDNQAPGGGLERQHGLRSKVIDHLTEIFKH